MTRIEFREPAGTFDVPGKGEFPQVFASHAFDGVIGKRVPMRGPDRQVIGHCTVVSVIVDPDGGAATWTVDMEDNPVADPVLTNELTMSFAFPDVHELPRDPLSSGELKVRWRHGPAVPAEESRTIQDSGNLTRGPRKEPS